MARILKGDIQELFSSLVLRYLRQVEINAEPKTRKQEVPRGLEASSLHTTRQAKFSFSPPGMLALPGAWERGPEFRGVLSL